MEAMSSETSTDFHWITRRYLPEENSHRQGNFKSKYLNKVFGQFTESLNQTADPQATGNISCSHVEQPFLDKVKAKSLPFKQVK
jgi:hypothetical protein